MKRKTTLSIILITVCFALYGQNEYSGIVFGKKSQLPVEYVNVGIAGKNIGTVTDANGKYSLLINSENANDSLLFSSIGYESYSIRISELKKNGNVYIEEKTYTLNEVIIKPLLLKERTFGIPKGSKLTVTGFQNSSLGYECGLLMNTKKKAYLKSVHLNVAVCSYDSVFFRLNIYQANNEMDYENILQEPIYVSASKEDVLKKGLSIDLDGKNITVEGEFLVALEHIKDLGEGKLFFSSSLKRKTYSRYTSQGEWKTLPIGMSLSVVADVEK